MDDDRQPTISENLNRVKDAIHRAAERSGRTSDRIMLVAVSKYVPLAQLKEAARWGISVFGESRVQEGVAKFLDSGFIKEIDALHFIGPLQTNKVNKAVGLFDVIHSVDSMHLAERISREAGRRGIRQSILIEVNIGGEKSKHGTSPRETPTLVDAIRRLPNLSLLGLMTVPPPSPHPEGSRPYFAALRTLGQRMDLHRFSMGMSSDFEVAIEEGATWVRVGTALFGKRDA
ncbi:MAG: YggS family pyridoxal phosphate-dependent enzyme [Nitrospiria bacterium]